jgi:hypothetical protein
MNNLKLGLNHNLTISEIVLILRPIIILEGTPNRRQEI